MEVDDTTSVEEDSPLGNFLDDVSLLTEIDGENNDSDSTEKQRIAANLMTIHASKGMEFEAVFLVGNEEGTFPTQRSIMEGEGSVELDEERRLCYVAMTRAKTHLVLTWRREVMTFFGQGVKIINPDRSRFLDLLLSQKKSKKNGKTKGNRSMKQSSQGTKIPKSNETFSTKTRNFSSLQTSDGTDSYRRPYGKNTEGVKRKNYTGQTAFSNGFPEQKNIRSINNISDGNRYARPQIRKTTQKKKGSIRSNNMNIESKQSSRMATSNRLRYESPKNQASQYSQKRAREKMNPQKTRLNPEDIPTFDSTAFFPLGTTVFHSAHGKGTVVQPNGGNTMVSVKFEEGIEINFPMMNSGLRIKY